MKTSQTYQQYYEEIFADILNKEYNEPPTVGMPRLYKTPKDLALKGIEYFVRQKELEKPLTFQGLSLTLKLWNPKSFYDYKEIKQYHDDFKFVIEAFQMILYDFNVEKLYTGHVQGAKFALSCCYSWTPTERQIIEDHTVKVKIGKKEESTDNE